MDQLFGQFGGRWATINAMALLLWTIIIPLITPSVLVTAHPPAPLLAHHTARAALADGVPLRILPLGDSITWGYGSSDGNGYRQHLRCLLLTDGRTVVYNAAVDELVRTHQRQGHRVLGADMYPALHAGADLGNGLHPNDAGYAKMATVWYSALVDAAGRGWVETPAELPSGAEACDGYLYWDPVYGAVTRPWEEDFVHVADLDGDGRDDYVWVDADSGAAVLYRNTGDFGNWEKVGQVASGIGAGEGVRVRYYRNGGRANADGGGNTNKWMWYDEDITVSRKGDGEDLIFADLDGDGRADLARPRPVRRPRKIPQRRGRGQAQLPGHGHPCHGRQRRQDRLHCHCQRDVGRHQAVAEPGVRLRLPRRHNVFLADLDGDGKDDYLVVSPAGAIEAYVNGGTAGGSKWIWYPRGQVASGVAKRANISGWLLADIDGDGKADYLVVDPLNGAVTMYRNGGPGSTKWIWFPVEQPIATGVDYNGYAVRFADLNGDGRAEYLGLAMGNGALQMWYNGCTGDEPDPRSGPPATLQDPIHGYGDGKRCRTDVYDRLDDIPATDMFDSSRPNSQFVDMANHAIRDWTRDNGDYWFDCTVTERVYCCSNCKLVVEKDHPGRCKYCVARGSDDSDDECHMDLPSADAPFSFRNVSERCPPNYDDRGVGGNGRQSVYWRIRDGKSWANMAAQAEHDVGINATFDWWYRAPMITRDYSARDVANPKAFLELAIPAYRTTPQDPDGIAHDLRANWFRIDGDRVDPAEYPWVVSVFASSLNENIVGMREIVRLADEIDEQERQRVITMWLSIVALVLPLIGPYVAPSVGFLGTCLAANFVRNVLTAGRVLTSWGLAIYDPDMIPLILFTAFVHGGITVKTNMAQMGYYIRFRHAVLYNTMGGALKVNHDWLASYLSTLEQIALYY
ncbi:uncharacterized protein B0T15DRAFT_511502 [Chaetomium strumarium]|uniref:VCBS repeat-containing protein n=1 Tax=Chaetomium strumarium TaxID=1170767 RepID=A0AAJ0GT19_9PEZI|nr:hypothetical protein B0T15DRAFT_511502 [Chaetomium strumarium]